MSAGQWRNAAVHRIHHQRRRKTPGHERELAALGPEFVTEGPFSRPERGGVDVEPAVSPSYSLASWEPKRLSVTRPTSSGVMVENRQNPVHFAEGREREKSHDSLSADREPRRGNPAASDPGASYRPIF